MHDDDLTILSHAYERAQRSPRMMAYLLTLFQRQHRFSDDDLARYLGVAPDVLPRLGLCGRPSDDGDRRQRDVAWIARGLGVNAERLTELVEGALAAEDALAEEGSLAPMLRAYRQDQGMSEQALAAWLGVSPDDLQPLSLYGEPAAEAPATGRDVRAIAAASGVNEERLLELVRHVQALPVLRAPVSRVRHRVAEEPGWLAAARDADEGGNGDDHD